MRTPCSTGTSSYNNDNDTDTGIDGDGDGDGLLDRVEIAIGTDPCDALDPPPNAPVR